MVDTAGPPPGPWQPYNGLCELHKASIFPAGLGCGWGGGAGRQLDASLPSLQDPTAAALREAEVSGAGRPWPTQGGPLGLLNLLEDIGW